MSCGDIFSLREVDKVFEKGRVHFVLTVLPVRYSWCFHRAQSIGRDHVALTARLIVVTSALKAAHASGRA